MREQLYFGVYKAIVSNVKDPEKRGRIKVLCPDVLDGESESAWCEPCVPVAYDNGGDFCIPQIDEAVWITFNMGDCNQPVYLGGWWEVNKTPLGDTYTNLDTTRVISYNDCTITMTNGKISINVGAGAGDLVIENQKITIEGNLQVNGTITSTSTIHGSNI